MATPAAEGTPYITPAMQASIDAAAAQQAKNYPAIQSSTPSQQVTQPGITQPPPLNFGPLPTAPTFSPPPVGTQGTPLDLIGIQNQLGGITNQQMNAINGVTPPQFQMPNIEIPKYNVPQPTQVTPPQHGDFLAYLRRNGLDPNTFFSGNGNGASGSNSGGSYGGTTSGGYTAVTAPTVAFNAPAYNPSRTIEQRVKDLLDAEFKGQKTQLDFNEAELKSIMDAAMAGQQEYGRLGDAKLKEIYDALHGTLAQGNADNAAMWQGTQTKTGQIYDQAGNAIAQQSGQTLSKLAELAQQLGVQAAFPEAAKYGAESANNFGNLNTANRASSQQYLNEMAGHSAAYDQRVLGSSDQYGADQRAQLQSIVASTLGQMGLEKTRGLADIGKDRFLVSQQEGLKAPVYMSDLEDKDWERNYMVSKDSAQFGLENAKLGLQAQAMNQEMERFAQEMGFKNKQAMFEILGKGYDYNFQDQLAQYNAQNDYQDRLQNWGNNQFDASMQGANLGLNINQISNQLLQNNFSNQFGLAGAKADILGQGRQDIATLIGAQNSNNNLTMAQNELDLNRWNMGNNAVNQAFANQMSIYGQDASNQTAKANQNFNILQLLGQREDAATGVNQFNANMQLELAKFAQGVNNTAYEQNFQTWRAKVGDKVTEEQARRDYARLQLETVLGLGNLRNQTQQVNNQTVGVAQDAQRIQQTQQQIGIELMRYNQSVTEWQAAQAAGKTAAEVAAKKAIVDQNQQALGLTVDMAKLMGIPVNSSTVPGWTGPGINITPAAKPADVNLTNTYGGGQPGATNYLNSKTRTPTEAATLGGAIAEFGTTGSFSGAANNADRTALILQKFDQNPYAYTRVSPATPLTPAEIARIRNELATTLYLMSQG